MILAAAAWLALIIVTRIDELFFPGQGISVGGLSVLPGVENNDGPKGRINILVLGLDRREREGEAATRTDTMFVLTIDPQTKTAGILGIPRDSWVEIPTQDGSGYYESRANTAYPLGETQGYAGGGAELAERMVEHNLGVPIDHYIIIDVEGFVNVIDELGGVNVYVEEEVNDPFYSRTELPGDYYPLHFDIGEQHMDGETALDYSRTRFDSSDLDRIHRQQQVIFAAIDEAVDQRLVNPSGLIDLWGKYKDAFKTDINDFETPGLANLAAQIDRTDIHALSLGAATTPWTTPDGAAVLLIDKDIVQELVDALFTDQELADEAAFVEVQNGAGAEGLSAQVIEYLGEFGFSGDSLAASNAAGGSVVPLTEIVDFAGKQHTVQRLANLLGVPAAQVRSAGPADAALRTVGEADVVVILGADAQTRDFTIETDGEG